jgi:hypothetical protein
MVSLKLYRYPYRPDWVGGFIVLDGHLADGRVPCIRFVHPMHTITALSMVNYSEPTLICLFPAVLDSIVRDDLLLDAAHPTVCAHEVIDAIEYVLRTTHDRAVLNWFQPIARQNVATLQRKIEDVARDNQAARTRARTRRIKRELTSVAWHPSRMMDWCLSHQELGELAEDMTKAVSETSSRP